MKVIMIIAACIFLTSSATVLAAGPYVGASAGIGLVYNDEAIKQIFGSSDAVGGAWNASLGYDFDGYRVEAEYGYKYVSYVLASGNIASYMVNGYYDFKRESKFKPFVGAGMGVVNGEIEEDGYSARDSSLAGQVTIGGGYNLNKRTVASLYYRFERAFSDFSDQGAKVPYGSNNFMFGLRYNF